MTALAPKRMTVSEFLDWNADDRHGRYELHEGRPVAMTPERIRHTEIKFAAAVALRNSIRRANLDCHMLSDGPAVRIDAHTAYGPDALVYCGPRLAGDAITVPAPVIVVEVLSPSSAHADLGAKLAGYFKVPSLAHYLVLDPERRMVIHHARGEAGLIATRIVTEGTIDLSPPGLTVAVAELFADG